MPSISETFGGKSMKALVDIPVAGKNFTIASIEPKDFDDGPKLIIGFRGCEKTLVCNRTNAGIIAELHGDDTDDWIDRRITLYATKTDFSGKRVDCIRVRDRVPVPQGATKAAARPTPNADNADADEGEPFDDRF
jgi:hypothetical protein